MAPLFLGLDLGSTMAKAAVFDRRGRTLASASRKIAVTSPLPGWMERDAVDTWRICAKVLRLVSAGHAIAIRAVGVTGCGNGGVFLDEAERPIRPGILSSDTRAAGYLSEDQARTRQTAYAGQTGALLRWLRAKEPRQALRLRHVLFWKDFIRLKLTGDRCTDFTDAGASGLLDARTRHWLTADPVWPKLRESLASAGTVQPRAARATGLVAGTPVYTGCIDCEAAALGSGVNAAGEFSLVAGTWSINQTFVSRLARAGTCFLCNPSAQPGRWLWLEGSPTSAANFDWATRALLSRPNFRRAVALAESSAPSDLIFVPRAPQGEGAFFGLSVVHTAGDLLRAVMVGVAYAHRAHVEKLRWAGLRCGKIRLAGGAAHSPFWCQIFADVLGRPVEIPRGQEIGALGAALCAAVGSGAWPSLRAAQRDTVAVARVYHPSRGSRRRFQRNYERFLVHWSRITPV